jgi:hypothetical protein
MPPIRTIEMQIIDKIFGMESGYVLNFSDRTMSNFFSEELNIDIDDPQYREDGTSKAKRLRCFLRKVDAATCVRVLRTLWEYREAQRTLYGHEEEIPNAPGQLFNLLNRLEGKTAAPQAHAAPGIAKTNYAGMLGDLMQLNELPPQPRGYAFEKFLTRSFNAFGLLARGGFRTVGEQIDGSFVLGSETYLVEARWQNAMTPAADLYAFRGKVSARATWARGLFISYSGFTADGLTAYGRGGNVICMDGLDLSDSLSRELPLNHVLEQKVRSSVETGKVLARVRDLFP